MYELICKKYKKALGDLLRGKKVGDADIAVLLENVGIKDALAAMREIVTAAPVTAYRSFTFFAYSST